MLVSTTIPCAGHVTNITYLVKIPNRLLCMKVWTLVCSISATNVTLIDYYLWKCTKNMSLIHRSIIAVTDQEQPKIGAYLNWKISMIVRAEGANAVRCDGQMDKTFRIFVSIFMIFTAHLLLRNVGHRSENKSCCTGLPVLMLHCNILDKSLTIIEHES
jgi:hypothetical protein